MARAYCLSCNELVTVTASGTCPEGHAVSTDEHAGPEPWVGYAGDREVPAAANHHGGTIDIALLQEAPPRTNGHDHGHVDGLAHALADLHDPDRDGEASHGTRDGDGAEPVAEEAVDDVWAQLSSLDAELADLDVELDQLGTAEIAPEAPPAGDPADTPPSDAFSSHDVDLEPGEAWDELAHLAAELSVDDDGDDDAPTAPTDEIEEDEPFAAGAYEDLLAAAIADTPEPDGPAEPEAAALAPPPDPEPEPVLPRDPEPAPEPTPEPDAVVAPARPAGPVDAGVDAAMADLEAAFAALEDDTVAVEDLPSAAPPVDPPPPPPPAAETALPPPVAAPDPTTPAPPPPAVPEDTEGEDDFDPAAVWAQAEAELAADSESEAPPATPRLDPTNFTAKGAQVGGSAGGSRKRRWKR